MATGTLWTSRQVVREFLAVMSRPQTFFTGNVPMADILNRVHTIESQCRVAEDGPDVAQQLHALLVVGDTRGKQIHDANIVTTMLGARDPDLAHGQCRRLCPLGPPHRGTSAVAMPTSHLRGIAKDGDNQLGAPRVACAANHHQSKPRWNVSCRWPARRGSRTRLALPMNFSPFERQPQKPRPGLQA